MRITDSYKYKWRKKHETLRQKQKTGNKVRKTNTINQERTSEQTHVRTNNHQNNIRRNVRDDERQRHSSIHEETQEGAHAERKEQHEENVVFLRKGTSKITTLLLVWKGMAKRWFKNMYKNDSTKEKKLCTNCEKK